MLAAFAQVQSLTEALAEHIKMPHTQPADILTKSASLCDDCYKNADKRDHETVTNKSTPQLQQSTGTSNISQTTSASSVINKKLTESITEATDISPDDDGYCEIDEIRLPAITKSPSIKVKDPRRQSAAAPLPPPSTESNDSMSNSNTTDDVTANKSPTPSECKSISNHETLSEELTFNASTASSSSASANTVISNKACTVADVDHIEVNYTYDSLSQSLSALCVTSETKFKTAADLKKQLRSLCESQCLPEMHLGDAQAPCHLIVKLLPYVASLNLHISQLLVSFIRFVNILFICFLILRNLQTKK